MGTIKVSGRRTKDGRTPSSDDKTAFETGRREEGAVNPINLTNHKRSPLK